MLGAAGFVATTVGGAWFLGWITDHVILVAADGRVDSGTLGLAVGVLMAISVASGIAVIMRRMFLMMAVQRTQRDWRRQLLYRYVDLPMSLLRKRRIGELLAHSDADLETATSFLMPLAFALSVVLLLVSALVVLLLVHPVLMLIAVSLFLTLSFVSRTYIRLVEAPSAEVQQRVGKVSAVAYESFDGAVVVKTLGREHAEVERLKAAAERLKAQRIRVGRMRATFEPLIDGIPAVGTVFLLLVGAWLVDRGSVSAGDLVVAATLFGLLTMPLRIMGFFLEGMPRSVVSMDRVDKILDLQPEFPVSAKKPASKLTSKALSLEIEDLVVDFDGHRVLDGVSFAVSPGETVVLVGPTGSGKSTLLEAITGLIEINSGSIQLNGIPIEEVDRDTCNAALAIAFQEAFLFAGTIAENVTLQRNNPRRYDDSYNDDFRNSDIRNHNIWSALTMAAASEFVAALPGQLEAIVGERGITLSGGQRQRVALARALFGGPQLLMLDDATSAVDPLVESRIFTSLRSLSVTTIMVAYRMSTLESGDRVVYLENGRVLATATHKELLQRADYRSLVAAYELQNLVRHQKAEAAAVAASRGT